MGLPVSLKLQSTVSAEACRVKSQDTGKGPEFVDLRSSSGSLAMLAAMRRASDRVWSLEELVERTSK